MNDSDISITYYNGDITTGDLLTPLPANAGNRPDNVVVIRVRRNWIWIVRSLMSASPSVLEGTSADRMESLGAGQNPPPRI
ncbi:MAG TPA: hypothetical protein VER03_17025 [Bryobacteraceae bacterium]|nr:hypothetical protein [Bryobacteraceae bacterium]